jgi:uncharacterized iron-regulated membrane protein
MIFNRFFNRQLWVLVHRYAGLTMAFFLIVAGLTGSILAFDGELQEWLNPEASQTVAEQPQPMLDPFTLRERALALEPKARIDSLRLDRGPGDIFIAFLTPRADPATGQEYTLSDSVIRLDPYTGALIPNPPEAPEPDNPYWPITRQNFINLVFSLHFTLLLGDLGVWLFGIAAVIWTLDCFVGFYLTLPVGRRRGSQGSSLSLWERVRVSLKELNNMGKQAPLPKGEGNKSFWQRWQVAWKVKWPSSMQRLNFDLHRAGGLWTWPLLFIFAWSSVELNLYDEVYSPVMNTLFDIPNLPNYPPPELSSPRLDPAIDFREAYATGKRLLAQLAHDKHVNVLEENALSYDPATGLYQYMFTSDWGLSGSLGMSFVLIDGNTGALVTSTLADEPTLGGEISDYLHFLHRKMIWGRPWQIVNCSMGLVITMLSVTGVYLWWVKQRAAKAKQNKMTSGENVPGLNN